MLARSFARVVKLPQVQLNGSIVRGLSTVQERTIHLTFVDRSGNRVSIPAKIGQTLLQAAWNFQIDIEGPCRGGSPRPEVFQHTEKWREQQFGIGPECFYCHVQIPTAFKHLLPELSPNGRAGLKFLWEEEFTASSHLACQIKLEKKHDGMVVFVPDPPEMPCM
mmetsp:Transcript_2026/g.1477  ORF Transcript_2026/g.1477 Transcript_2026/m.1477 type:complete len:164 (+) Transcript_2026:50-541(+)|eukprot:CAMPEP_0202963912 /NCGR_PEP_ID=MMETSP1396-20130829/7966_1 /ASSEMBLY_ACC=CAM_ASM_000872 /TAXON_ID= /ORGANISM="Pseudokeronopsis sp., Strain Brazil" /LENGTH=163 /DNA_ID=CAMNT_0049685569 /DNA_START=48 /DNA_END=539 /DNA_ORIENTATION=-